MLPSRTQRVPGTRRSSNASVMLALSCLLVLSACAATPPQCQPVVPPNPDLMKAPPTEGYFRKHLDQILAPSYTGPLISPTN